MEPLILPVIFFAFFIQSLTGFGSGLIAMPLLITLLGVEAAAPLFSLVGITSGTLMLARYRGAWQFRSIWRVWIASFIMIPIGVVMATRVDEHLVMAGLGVFTLGYALYALFGATVPRIKNQRWSYGFGLAAGLLHGAYNTGGPPLVIYGSSQNWQPQEFKGNLQGLFFINGLLVICSHFLTGHYTPLVLENFFVTIPVLLIALALGFSLERFVNPDAFRRGVMGLLIIIALTLIF